MLTITVEPNHAYQIDDLVIYGTYHRVIAVDGNVLTLEPFDYGAFKTEAQTVHDAERTTLQQGQALEREAMYARHAQELKALGEVYLAVLGEWTDKMEHAPKVRPAELEKRV